MTLKQRVSELKDALISKLNSLKSNIDTRALRTTKVVAGTGLSGGGDLTTSRTLSVNFGSTAGTAVEGNDPRLDGGGTSGPHTHTKPEIISYLGYTPQDESRRVDDIFLDHLNTTKYPSNKGIFHFATPIANFTASGTTHTGVLCSEGVPQMGRDVILNNVGSSVIIACVTETRARYTKKNAGTVTFVKGPGRTLVTVNGTATVNGPAGQQVELISNGTVDTLYHIDNIPSALKADKTINLIAGTGITGGGTIAANRTFNADFGTGVNQVARGNHTHEVTIKIAMAGNITTTATDPTGLGQDKMNVILSNGAANRTLTVISSLTATYLKSGTGSITFFQGAGRTLVNMSGTFILNGLPGSNAKIVSDGTTDYLYINNY